jgi:DNA-binding CsgD family transcriptional regulator
VILGRELEQTEIQTFLDLVRAGEGRFLVMIGEPGIGKTTLLDWTAGAGDGVTVLRAAGRESEADLPFVAVADLLRPLQDQITLLPGPQARALGSALAYTAPATGDRGAVNAAVLNLLGAASRERALLLLVDNYHWLDSASRDVIDFVARRTEPFGVGLVLTTRGPVPADHRGSELQIDPLQPEVAAALVLRRAQVPPEVVRRILELAAGNPLALVELPLSLTAQQLEAPMPLNQPVSVSAAVERAYRARLDDLPEASRRALICAAEEGSDSLATVLRALAAMGLGSQSIEPAVAADLLVVSGSTIRFRHPLLRSVVHQTAEPKEVRHAHLALAHAVDDEDQRAWHLAAAAIGPDNDAAAALEETARRALARGAAANAASAFRRAAELSEQISERGRRTAVAARAAHRAGNMALTARLIEEARALNGDARHHPTLLLLDADIRMRRGDFAGAYGALRLEATGIADRDPQRAATMLLLASKLRVYRFEATEAMKEVDQALTLVPESERDLVHLASVAMTRTMAGHPGARDAVLLAMEAAIAAPHGHTHTLGIGWPLVWLEEYELARAFISRSVDIQREGGHLAYLPQALLALAELDFRTGRWDLARLNASEALRLFEEGQQPTEAAIASALLARLAAVCGDDEAARRYAATAEASDLRSGLRAATAHAEAAIGLLDLGQGHYLDAIEHLRQARAVAISGGIGEPWLLPLDADLAEAYIRSSDRTAGNAVSSELARRAKALGRRSAIAAALRCEGLAAGDDSFRPFFEEAISIHEQTPAPFEMARTELCYGERLRRARHRVEARSRLKRALAIFENLGAEPWVKRALAELSASGETLQRRSPVATLTPQERQVASIVGSGATNREAAAVLFVSPKTIEFHLGNVYRKLRIRSRTELANTLSVAKGKSAGA